MAADGSFSVRIHGQCRRSGFRQSLPLASIRETAAPRPAERVSGRSAPDQVVRVVGREGASGRLRRGSRSNPPADREETGPADAPCFRQSLPLA
jgi:hypothetical protein